MPQPKSQILRLKQEHAPQTIDSLTCSQWKRTMPSTATPICTHSWSKHNLLLIVQIQRYFEEQPQDMNK